MFSKDFYMFTILCKVTVYCAVNIFVNQAIYIVTTGLTHTIILHLLMHVCSAFTTIAPNGYNM